MDSGCVRRVERLVVKYLPPTGREEEKKRRVRLINGFFQSL